MIGDVAVLNHRWLPAVFNPARPQKSVECGWRMNAWGDGQVFCEEDPASTVRRVAMLPSTNPQAIRFRGLEEVCEATWEVPWDMVKKLQDRLDWNFRYQGVHNVCATGAPSGRE